MRYGCRRDRGRLPPSRSLAVHLDAADTLAGVRRYLGLFLLSLQKIPPSVLAPPGLVGVIAQWIDACAVHPAPLLSVAAALSVVSTLAGRRYCLPSGLRACTYVVGVAKSGVGKEIGRQCAVALLDRCGLRRRVGTGSIASGAGLVARLSACPTQLFLLDELGRLLEAFASRNAGTHEREIMTVLMELWSAAPGVFLGKAYAERDAPVIEMPHTVIYGTTTPDAFYAALKGRDVVDGVLSRLIVLEVEHDQLPEAHPTANSAEPSAALVAACKALAAGPANGNLDGVETSTMRSTPLIVPLTAAAADAAAFIGQGLTAHLGTVEHRDLWVRAKEQTLRVALAVAVGDGKIEVEEGHLKWAWDLVRWSTKRLELAVAERVADTDEGRACQAVMAALAAAGGVISARDLARSKHARKLDRRARKAAIDELLDVERISQHTAPACRNGKQSTTYALRFDDDPEPDT